MNQYQSKFYFVLGLFMSQYFKHGGTSEELKDQHPYVVKWMEEAYATVPVKQEEVVIDS